MPCEEELQKFESCVLIEMDVPEKMREFFKSFHYDAAPMAMLVSVVASLPTFNSEPFNIWCTKDREKAMISIIAKMPTIAAMAYRTSLGLPVVKPRRDLSYVQNLLWMMFKDPSKHEGADPNIPPELLDAMETWLILHADHEQNASTSTVRIAGSSLASP